MMTSTIIQRQSWLTLILSVLFVVSYMHEISAQYQEHHHCGGDEATLADTNGTLNAQTPATGHSHFQIPDSDDKTQQTPSPSDCSCTHCSPGVATLLAPFVRPGSTVTCSELFPGQLLKAAKFSDGIDHPPNLV
ncbi:MAG: hypothetical protein QM496_08420 [Verrucomicrobiota bacterium]